MSPLHTVIILPEPLCRLCHHWFQLLHNVVFRIPLFVSLCRCHKEEKQTVLGEGNYTRVLILKSFVLFDELYFRILWGSFKILKLLDAIKPLNVLQ